MPKTNSRHKILSLIRRDGPIGQARIAKAIGQSLPAVMNTVRFLVDAGLVRYVDGGSTTVGKPPKLLEFIKDSYYCIGIDIGATKITCILMDGTDIVLRHEIPNEFERGPKHAIKRLVGTVGKLLASSRIDVTKLLGIGLASPGLFDPSTRKLVYAPLIGWRDVDFATPLEQAFNVFVCVDNSVRVTSYGEKIYGSAKNNANFLCLHLGHGIGGALTLGDELHTGAFGTAGEVGHIIVRENGPVCNCGKRGCLEAVASARAIVRDAREKMRSGASPLLAELAGGKPEQLNAQTVFAAANRGDKASLKIIGNAMRAIGVFIGGVINFLDLELIILEGGLSRADSPYIDMLKEAVNTSKMALAGRGARIVVSELGADATAIGAAAMVVEQQLETDLNRPRGE